LSRIVGGVSSPAVVAMKGGVGVSSGDVPGARGGDSPKGTAGGVAKF